MAPLGTNMSLPTSPCPVRPARRPTSDGPACARLWMPCWVQLPIGHSGSIEPIGAVYSIHGRIARHRLGSTAVNEQLTIQILLSRYRVHLLSRGPRAVAVDQVSTRDLSMAQIQTDPQRKQRPNDGAPTVHRLQPPGNLATGGSSAVAWLPGPFNVERPRRRRGHPLGSMTLLLESPCNVYNSQAHRCAW